MIPAKGFAFHAYQHEECKHSKGYDLQLRRTMATRPNFSSFERKAICPYQAKVMKVLEMTKRPTVASALNMSCKFWVQKYKKSVNDGRKGAKICVGDGCSFGDGVCLCPCIGRKGLWCGGG